MGKFSFNLSGPPDLHRDLAREAGVRSLSSSLKAKEAAKRRSCTAAVGHLVDAASHFGEVLAHRRTGGMTPEVNALLVDARTAGTAAATAVRGACTGRKPRRKGRARRDVRAKTRRRASSRRRGTRRRRRDRYGRFI